MLLHEFRLWPSCVKSLRVLRHQNLPEEGDEELHQVHDAVVLGESNLEKWAEAERDRACETSYTQMNTGYYGLMRYRMFYTSNVYKQHSVETSN